MVINFCLRSKPLKLPVIFITTCISEYCCLICKIFKNLVISRDLLFFKVYTNKVYVLFLLGLL